MEYTNQFHLPQWAASDPVLRTDFNEAMAALENSLAESRENAFRLACNHLLALEAAGDIPRQKGVFRQSLAGDELPDGVTGMAAHGDYCWVHEGAALSTPAKVRESVVVKQTMRLNKGNLADSQPLAFTFSTLNAGPFHIMQIQINGTYSNNEGCRGLFRLTITNQATGEVEVEKDIQCVDDSSSYQSGSGSRFLNLYVNVRGGAQYRLEIAPLESAWTISYEYVTLLGGVVTAPSGSVAHTFQEDEDSRGGVVLARYTVQGEGGTLTLDWEGETISPHAVRTITDENGLTLNEAEFHKGGAVPAESTVQLNLTAIPTGGLSLYHWGAILI